MKRRQNYESESCKLFPEFCSIKKQQQQKLVKITKCRMVVKLIFGGLLKGDVKTMMKIVMVMMMVWSCGKSQESEVVSLRGRTRW